MKRWKMLIGSRECTIYARFQEQVQFLLLQPVDDNDLAVMDNEAASIENAVFSNQAGTKYTDSGFVLAVFKIHDWNSELTPWEAPPVWGKQGYGSGAQQTLDYVLHTLLPFLQEQYDPQRQAKIILGGYSLAGLFALWAGYQEDKVWSAQKTSIRQNDNAQDRLNGNVQSQLNGNTLGQHNRALARNTNSLASVFSGIAAASPSVWYPGWINYAQAHTPQTPVVYLSLGDREEHTRNPIMSTVGNCIRQQYALLQQQGIRCTLEWNPGNHFKNSDLRTAWAFAWVISQLG